MNEARILIMMTSLLEFKQLRFYLLAVFLAASLKELFLIKNENCICVNHSNDILGRVPIVVADPGHKLRPTNLPPWQTYIQTLK